MPIIIAIVTFIVVLGFLVLVHELGHFLTARKMGMGIEEFGIGFPPRLMSKRKNGVLYSLNALPLGGYVKIKGEDGEHAEDQDSFAAKPVWKRALVLAAGVSMNIIAGWLLLVILFSVGAPMDLSDNIDAKYIKSRSVIISEVLPDSPALEAGLQENDEVLTVDGREIKDIKTFQDLIDANSQTESAIVYKRNKKTATLSIAPRVMESVDAQKKLIGVALTEVGIVRFPVHRAIIAGAQSTGAYLKAIVLAFSDVIAGLFKGKGAGGIGGPIAIAVRANDVAQMGFSHIIIFTVVLSFNLAIINILPFPALDGGRLIFLAIEKIRRRPSRKEIEEWFHRVGFTILILLMIAITYRDIARFGGRIWQAVIG